VSSLQFSKKIALRYLWSRRSEAFITIISVISVLGVAIGVTVLNIVMAVMTGFEYELRDKIVGANSHIVVRKIGGKVENWPAAMSAIQGIKGVEDVSAFTYHQALLRTPTSSSGVLIRGIQKGSHAARQLQSYMEKQDIEELFDPPPVETSDAEGNPDEAKLPGLVVGRELVKSMGLYIGKPVSIFSAGVSSTPFGLAPKFRRFTVAGSYKSGLVEYESGLAYASLEEAQRFFQMGNAVSGLEVRVFDIEQSSQISKVIIDTLGQLGGGFYAQDWTETNKSLWDAIKLEKRVYFIVLLLIIVMASFSIITTLIMIVLEKRKDIAILKTMGATTSSIANIFRLQGAAIGALGTVLGLIGGYLGCLILREYGFPIDETIFQMATLPIRIEGINFFLTGAAAFVICCTATVYPARRASQLEPSDVLRYE
jgi:lipoprotein-releasing system permease protein